MSTEFGTKIAPWLDLDAARQRFSSSGALILARADGRACADPAELLRSRGRLCFTKDAAEAMMDSLARARAQGEDPELAEDGLPVDERFHPAVLLISHGIGFTCSDGERNALHRTIAMSFATGNVASVVENATRWSAVYFDLDALVCGAELKLSRVKTLLRCVQDVLRVFVRPESVEKVHLRGVASAAPLTPLSSAGDGHPAADPVVMKAGIHLNFFLMLSCASQMRVISSVCASELDRRLGAPWMFFHDEGVTPPREVRDAMSTWKEVVDVGVYGGGFAGGGSLRMPFTDKPVECAECTALREFARMRAVSLRRMVAACGGDDKHPRVFELSRELNAQRPPACKKAGHIPPSVKKEFGSGRARRKAEGQGRCYIPVAAVGDKGQDTPRLVARLLADPMRAMRTLSIRRENATAPDWYHVPPFVTTEQASLAHVGARAHIRKLPVKEFTARFALFIVRGLFAKFERVEAKQVALNLNAKTLTLRTTGFGSQRCPNLVQHLKPRHTHASAFFVFSLLGATVTHRCSSHKTSKAPGLHRVGGRACRLMRRTTRLDKQEALALFGSACLSMVTEDMKLGTKAEVDKAVADAKQMMAKRKKLVDHAERAWEFDRLFLNRPEDGGGERSGGACTLGGSARAASAEAARRAGRARTAASRTVVDLSWLSGRTLACGTGGGGGEGGGGEGGEKEEGEAGGEGGKCEGGRCEEESAKGEEGERQKKRRRVSPRTASGEARSPGRTPPAAKAQ